jgi:hypothetical protein
METPPRDLLTSVLSYLSEFPSLINVWCLRGEVAPQHLRLLLEHEDADVAVAAATGMRHAIGKAAIPMALRPIWRRAILRSGAEQDNLLGAFDGDSELAFEWLSMRMRAHPELFLHHDHNIGAAVDVLTFDQRGRLIDEVPDHPWLDDFLKKLIGDNLQLYQRLLRRSDVDRMHFVPLEGKPTSNWIQKVAAALDVGYAPSNIVRALEHQLWGWEGSESSTMARWIAAFEPLTKSADMRIREVALLFNTLAESRRSAALVRERREAVYGRD